MTAEKQFQTTLAVFYFLLIGVIIPVAAFLFANEVKAHADSDGPSPWVMDIDGSDYEAAEYPSVTAKGDYLYIVWKDLSGFRGEAYTHGNVIIRENIEVDDAR